MMDIGWAMKQLRTGKHVARLGWNRKDLRLGLQVPDVNSANTEPYVFLLIPSSVISKPFRIPWTCSQADLLATDWMVVL